MSTQRGNTSRTRPQKHKNRTVFKNDLHDKTPQMKKLNALHVCEVCERCKAVIEWKIKYKKYKPLTKSKTCIRCQNRNIKKAYHVLCRDCALKDKVCAKCLKSGDEVRIEPPEPTEEEQLKLKVEMENLVKSLPERKRRSFMRYMAKGKKEEVEVNPEDDISENDEEGEKDLDAVNAKPVVRIPHTREDLLKKIEELKVAGDDDDYFVDDSDCDDFSDTDSTDQ